MPIISNNHFLNLLGNCSIPFVLYCEAKATDNAKAVGYIFENVPGIDPASRIMVQEVLPKLKDDGIIDQQCIRRIFKRLDMEIPPPLRGP